MWHCLLRVGRYQGDREAVGYIVAMPNEDVALDLIRIKVAGRPDYVEDVGPVSEKLLNALKQSLGQFIRANDAAPSRSRNTTISTRLCGARYRR